MLSALLPLGTLAYHDAYVHVAAYAVCPSPLTTPAAPPRGCGRGSPHCRSSFSGPWLRRAIVPQHCPRSHCGETRPSFAFVLPSQLRSDGSSQLRRGAPSSGGTAPAGPFGPRPLPRLTSTHTLLVARVRVTVRCVQCVPPRPPGGPLLIAVRWSRARSICFAHMQPGSIKAYGACQTD